MKASSCGPIRSPLDSNCTYSSPIVNPNRPVRTHLGLKRLKTLRPRLAPAPTHGWQSDAIRGNRHERGYGAEWSKARERIKARAEGLCEPHAAIGLIHPGTQCDHRVPKTFGGSDDDSNLHWVCEAFHEAKTQIESRGEQVTNFDELARNTGGR